MKRSNKLFIEDILDATTKIEKYTKDLSYEDFVKNQMIIDAVVRNLEIIGEAARNIPKSIQKKYKDVPWNRMIGLRNIVIHGYFGIDLSIIWEIITKNLPETKPSLLKILKEIN